jgi:hypothetical protein
MVYVITSFVNFLIKDSNQEIKKFKSANKDAWYCILLMLGIYTLFTIAFGFLYMYIDETIGLPKHKINEVIKKSSVIKIVIMGVILAPVFEEFAFRKFLKYSKLNLALSLGFLFYFVLGKFIHDDFYSFDLSMILRIIFSSIIGLIPYVIISENKNKKLLVFWKKNFKFLLLLSIFFFASVHIGNYNFACNTDYYLIPILIFPQILLACICAFLRMNFGIQYAIIFHSIYNLLPILGAIASK